PDRLLMLMVHRRLFELLSKSDRLRFVAPLIVLIFLAMLEMAGIASILPFMAIVTNPETIHTSRLLSAVYEGLGFQGEETFLTFVRVFVLGLLVVNSTGKALSTWLMLRYQNRFAHRLARRLLASYMVLPYSFFLRSN